MKIEVKHRGLNLFEEAERSNFYFTNLPNGFNIGNPLMLNQGDGTFVENGVAAGVENNKTSWGAIFWDYDDDTDIAVMDSVIE